jgi:hypothetical protein
MTSPNTIYCLRCLSATDSRDAMIRGGLCSACYEYRKRLADPAVKVCRVSKSYLAGYLDNMIVEQK